MSEQPQCELWVNNVWLYNSVFDNITKFNDEFAWVVGFTNNP